MFWVPFIHHDLVRTHRFCIHLLDMLSPVTLLVFLIKDYGLSLRKGLNTDFHPGLILLSAGILSRMHFRRIVNAWSKKEGVGVHALNDWKNEFLRIIDITIDNFTKHPHLFKQPSSRSVKSLKKKMEKLHLTYVFAPADKAANNVIIIWKRHYVEVLKCELNSTSTYAPAQLTKDQLLVHHIDTLTKIEVKIDKCELPTFYWLPKLHKRPYKLRFISNSSHCSTTILSKHITSALTAVKDHVIKYSETAFSNSNVN